MLAQPKQTRPSHPIAGGLTPGRRDGFGNEAAVLDSCNSIGRTGKYLGNLGTEYRERIID